ncbi:hypothetical protein [Pedobacter heparinus]|uniref:Uncharacterized protein n=1 Tax=Pedobacter heparinus (strain ATCC 13125 / DSM 2366 / CIP 104194 / JCM 7457 / NBRC 12017 / NCIMB 9290 / NRRL B-14731 / HIM 762-3) TaxID=485917 RepID=C6XSH2_PEDHD|nr:hypothetical protein [Pedobacter heparinus]ACU03517.1 hypothetical protein Phep_1302 [Pedobacter heparinus DSM 2366]
MNLIAAHSSGIKTRLIMSIMIMGMLLNSCKKDKFNVPQNVGTIRFAANAYTIENNTVDPLTIVLPLSLPLEADATALITVDNQSTIAADQYTTTPAIPVEGLTLNLPKGATQISFQLSSLNNFEGEKTLVLKLSSATGGLSVANINSTASITIKGNPIVIPEIRTSEPGLAFGSVVTGTISDSKSYVLNATKLTSDVLISASANFQVSLDDNTFSSTLTIPFATANATPVTIYARFLATTGINQTVTGTISHRSGTVPDAVVNVSGVEFGVAIPGVLVHKEDFNYGTVANSITAVSGGKWTAYSASATRPVQYLSPGLTYTGYAGSGIGGALVMQNNGSSSEDVSMNFPAQSSGVVYSAQLMNFASGPTTADFFYSFGDGAAGATPAYFNRIYAKANGSKMSLGLGRNSTTVTYAAADLDYGVTYLVVSKYEFATNNSTLYILSGVIPTIEPATPSAVSNVSGADPTALTRIVVRQNTGVPLKVTIDGIRIATSWKEAVGL